MKHSKVISHRRIEITPSSSFIPYELAHNYGYNYAHNTHQHNCRWKMLHNHNHGLVHQMGRVERMCKEKH